ncbi:type III restriction-modification system endonuclease [Paratractidigestivibacter sp.]|uniref:type III restriction-modification system endonuclease n=1 Tax=Paratractidigestivibacter sp. TaxID=2847316 RepID=UPI002AC9307D|nr:DEAD/DEAH box helicase family protein [Paratractidigestivibacter sp.]
MQLKFKIQPYQTDAARAVTDVFKGQPNNGASMYLRDLGDTKRNRWHHRGFVGFNETIDDASGYANAPIELGSEKLLENLSAVQRANHLKESTSLAKGPAPINLDVEMETGTGKTYVYTKTMLELNRLYGWSKFIVVVPSVAIREGVYKSLQGTEQHFFEQYGKAIRYFIYDSSRLGELDRYSESADVNVMIINMQAFNTSMKEHGKSKEARIMYSERDEFGSRKPIDVLAANHPIVIQDEPQKMGGKATQDGIKRFQPLMCLNYSATHKEHHDCVYALDALDAFNQRLVKRIEVKGFELKGSRGTDGYLYLDDIKVSKNKAPQAVIEFKHLNASGSVSKKTRQFVEHDSIYTASDGLEAYRDYTVAEVVPDMDGQLGYVRFLNDVVLHRGEVYGDSAGGDMRRVQIRETIKSHLEKEEALFARGIKCLSLFFIDEVAKYREYGEDGEQLLGEYGQIFEEEYARAVDEYAKGQMSLDASLDAGLVEAQRRYLDYLRGIDAADTHKGYFSIDKKGRSVDSKVKRGSDESDDESAYDLILKDKERLLSFEEPTRFIFSHSALREGWDNPNVFQICTLKHSDSETGKRQEVGRGLRLCVNQDGERQDLEALGEGEVHRVNTLTVVASESYADFTKSLQADIRSVLRDRPKAVTEKFLTGLVVRAGEDQSYTLTEEDAGEIHYALIVAGLIDRKGQPTQKFRDEGMAAVTEDDLGEHLYAYKADIEMYVRSVYDEHALDGYIGNGHEEKVTRNPLNGNFMRAEFQELWNKINAKHSYTVEFDDEELRRKAIERIDKDLFVSKTAYVMTSATQRATQSRENLERGEGFGSTTRHDYEVGEDTGGVTYDLLGEVATAAKITRRSAAAILGGISPIKFAMFRDNPEEFIAKVSRCILAEKATMVVDHITYHKLDETYDSDIFAERMPESMSRAIAAKRCVQDYVVWDSDGERKFAEDLESAEGKVAVYAKLPRSFQIPTPVGNYAPDWAIAFEKDSVRHVFFVAETKGSMDSLALRDIEKGKIACARKLFNEFSDDDVRYDEVHTYEDLLNVIQGME